MPTVTPIPLAYNNVYLVEDGGERVLVDCGPDYEGAWEELQAALAGRQPDVVVATHGHSDHAGLGARWIEAGVPVAMGAADLHFTTAPPLMAHNEFEHMAAFVRECGAPARVVEEAIEGLERRRAQGRAAKQGYPPPGSRPHWPTGLRYRTFSPALALTGGEDLGAGLRVVACPGHTPGNVVLVHEAEGWLFSGDQLLPEITPTPAIQVDPEARIDWRFRSLPAFVRSMEGLARASYSRCFPGHGEAFNDVEALIATNLAQIGERTRRVAEAMGEGATLYEVCERLYPRALKRRFWQIVPTVLGHLDLIEAHAAR